MSSFYFSHRHLLWGVVRQFRYFILVLPCCYLPDLYGIGWDRVGRKRESNLCQSCSDFERCPHYDGARVKFMGGSHKSGCCFWCSVSIIVMCHGRPCTRLHLIWSWGPGANTDSTSYSILCISIGACFLCLLSLNGHCTNLQESSMGELSVKSHTHIHTHL